MNASHHVVVGHREKGMILIYLLLSLLLPLARIGFAPVALNPGRHESRAA